MLSELGYEIHRAAFSHSEIQDLRIEADLISAEAGSACVRNLTMLSERIRNLSVSTKLKALLPSLNYIPVRSILFDKTSAENWPVAWHQDLTIATKEKKDCDGYGPWSTKAGVTHTQAPVDLLRKMATIRIHLDPTDRKNGALIVSPCSHKTGRLSSDLISEFVSRSSYICECQPGDILLMSPLILHSSKRSTNPSRRRILHLEYAPQDALDQRLNWHETHST
ncbi:phytanoyl-CoA dioxygenase family protein [Luteolibacter sp. AS25]|uniref:phytanoyl-CoA dioxygenase family protein n=1 Tax=Luteolibacter sp. AS25 TaxID=3135776 RepID=UPI00398AD797